MNNYLSTKVLELGSCAFRQWRASHSHCRFLHGYQLKAKLWFRGAYLDDKNWVVDFGGLKELQKMLQNQFDHTTCVAGDDPQLDMFKQLDAAGVIQLRVMDGGVGIERAAEFVFHTADKYIRNLTHNRCWVEKVEVFEHQDNSAVYVEENISTTASAFDYYNTETPFLGLGETLGGMTAESGGVVLAAAPSIEGLTLTVDDQPANPLNNIRTDMNETRRPAPVGNSKSNKSLAQLLVG